MTVCGAKTRAGGTCRQPAAPGRTRCRYHGGRTPVGPALPSWKHGRYSKYLPARLLDRYTAARSDPDLLALHDEIALVDVRIAEVLASLDAGESEERWEALGTAAAEVRRCMETRDPGGMGAALTALMGVISSGSAAAQSWSELGGLIEQRRKLVESEARRLATLQQYITAERATALVAAVAEVVKRHVTDRDTLVRISAELGALLGRDPPALPDGRNGE